MTQSPASLQQPLPGMGLVLGAGTGLTIRPAIAGGPGIAIGAGNGALATEGRPTAYPRRRGRLFAAWVLIVTALVFSALMGSSIIAAMVLIVATGDSSVLVPLVMVAIIVVASLVATIAYARHIREARPEAVESHTERTSKEASCML